MNEEPAERALAMLAEVARRPEVAPGLPLADLHLDSLQLIEWLSMVEVGFGVEFDLFAMNFYTFGDLPVGEVVAKLLAQAGEAAGR